MKQGGEFFGNMYHFGSFSQPLGDIQNFSLNILFLYSNNSSFPAYIINSIKEVTFIM